MSTEEFSRSKLFMTPFVTRIFTLVILGCFFGSFFVHENVIKLLIDIPFYTFYNYELYRLFSSSFVGLDVVNLLITLYLFIPSTTYLEKYFGSTHVIFFILSTSVMINIFHDIVCFACFFASDDTAYLFIPSVGFLGIALSLYNTRCITETMNELPQFTVSCCGCKCRHRRLWYPILWLLVIYLFDKKFLFSAVLGIVLSIFQVHFTIISCRENYCRRTNSSNRYYCVPNLWISFEDSYYKYKIENEMTGMNVVDGSLNVSTSGNVIHWIALPRDPSPYLPLYICPTQESVPSAPTLSNQEYESIYHRHEEIDSLSRNINEVPVAIAIPL